MSEDIKEYIKFAKWVANEIFDDMWEHNKDAFAELACRKLEKLGFVHANGELWIKTNADKFKEVFGEDLKREASTKTWWEQKYIPPSP